MKKLFISQPMRGKTDEEIKAERAKAVEAASELVGEPVEVIDSFFQSAPVGANHCGFLENHWSFWQMQTWPILLRAGTMPVDASSNMIVRLLTESKVL